jgi:hypothetical protein
MFDNLSVKVAFEIIGYLSFAIVIFVYVVYFFGATMRKRSRLARKF